MDEEKIIDDFMKEYGLWNQDGFVGCSTEEDEDENRPHLKLFWLKGKDLINLPGEYQGLKIKVVRSGGIIPH